jgi:hypothetical protein
MIVCSGMMGRLAPKIWNDNFKKERKKYEYYKNYLGSYYK